MKILFYKNVNTGDGYDFGTQKQSAFGKAQVMRKATTTLQLRAPPR